MPTESSVALRVLPSVPGRLPLTQSGVESIVAIPDDAVRNLWIIQSYANLGERLLRILETDQTWCTFATWASNTAGLSIRGEELPKLVGEVLLGADPYVDSILHHTNAVTKVLRDIDVLGPLQHSHLEHLVAQAIGQVSAFIAEGNTFVYKELAPLFIRFIDMLEQQGPPDAGAIDEALDRVGIPTSTQAPLVRLAFQQYSLASATADDALRAQHVLAGNIAAVLHEQKRLQNVVASALDAGLLDFGHDICGIAKGRVSKAILRPLVTEVRAHIAPELEQLWQHIATRLMMTLSVPGQTLHLSRDVPPIPGESQLFSPELARVTLPALAELLSEWDRTNGTGRGSGAKDWADIHQRMNYIVNLFRSRQRHLALTTPPFGPDDIDYMVRGEIPPRI